VNRISSRCSTSSGSRSSRIGYAPYIVRMEGEALIAEIYTVFKDQSGRSNYFAVERLIKQSGR
jgi:hypothetical protein